MCGRYYIDDDDTVEELRAIVMEVQRKLDEQGNGEKVKTGEVFPSDVVPVIANNKHMAPVPFAMKWGYSLPGGKLIINARSETAADKPIFRDGMLNRRCLIPATNYFEWEKHGKQKVKYAIRSSGRPMLYMAGIYRIEKGRAVFSILTREPAEQIAFIHDRMPVILPDTVKAEWLDPRNSADELLQKARLDVIYETA